MLKLKFQVLDHGITYHCHDNIYYISLGCVLLHDMMVEACVNNNEVDDVSMYDVLELDNGTN